MKPTILIIDDDCRNFRDKPLLWELEDEFGRDYVELIENPEVALEYIGKNVERNLIVLLDIQFPGMSLGGHEILKKIRELTEIIPVILYTGATEDGTFSDFINNHAFGFLSKAASNSEILAQVRKAKEYYENSLDNTIEDWIANSEDDRDKPIFFTADGKSFTLNQILIEIRKQTIVGKTFARRLNELSIDLLLRNKRRIDG